MFRNLIEVFLWVGRGKEEEKGTCKKKIMQSHKLLKKEKDLLGQFVFIIAIRQ